MDVKQLQSEAINYCYNSSSKDHMRIMKIMIEKAYHEGRKLGQQEMSKVARENLSNLIPNELI